MLSHLRVWHFAVFVSSRSKMLIALKSASELLN